MQYHITKQAVKQSIKNMSSFFKEKGFEIPKNVYLEGFAKALSFKNWNTLDGMINHAKTIPNTKNKKIYIIEIEVQLDKNIVEKELISSFSLGKCDIRINQAISHNNNHQFELTFPTTSDNFLTGMMFFAKRMKPHNLTRFEMLRMNIEKENLIGLLKI